MTWQPATESKMWDFMNEAWDRMSTEQRRLWEVVRISPQKWKLTPWGDKGGGFWVVGIIGNAAIWYNDIEGGFNHSKYSAFGTIDEYWCNQDELEWTVQRVLNEILKGEPPEVGFGPPVSGEYE